MNVRLFSKSVLRNLLRDEDQREEEPLSAPTTSEGSRSSATMTERARRQASGSSSRAAAVAGGFSTHSKGFGFLLGLSLLSIFWEMRAVAVGPTEPMAPLRGTTTTSGDLQTPNETKEQVLVAAPPTHPAVENATENLSSHTISPPLPFVLQVEQNVGPGRLSETEVSFLRKSRKHEPEETHKPFRGGFGINFFSYLSSSEGGSHIIPYLPSIYILDRFHPNVELDVGVEWLSTLTTGPQNLTFSNLNVRAIIHVYPLSSRRGNEPLLNFHLFAGLRGDVIDVSDNQGGSEAGYFGCEFGAGVQFRVSRHLLFRFLEIGGIVEGKFVGDPYTNSNGDSFLASGVHSAFFARSGIVAVF